MSFCFVYTACSLKQNVFNHNYTWLRHFLLASPASHSTSQFLLSMLQVVAANSNSIIDKQHVTSDSSNKIAYQVQINIHADQLDFCIIVPLILLMLLTLFSYLISIMVSLKCQINFNEYIDNFRTTSNYTSALHMKTSYLHFQTQRSLLQKSYTYTLII